MHINVKHNTRKTSNGRLALAYVMCLMTASPTPSLAQSVATKLNPSGNGGQRPAVDTAPNGVPVVQITAPNSRGVSMNQWQALSVGPEGVIFNNGLNPSDTKLAGWIDGNARLNGRSAGIIVNQVLGSEASALRGFMEVAGARADLIIANPNGVTCNGCGFINANRGVLTTGTPQFDGAGGLAGWNVGSGRISIEGSGLNAYGASYTDILARAVQVNAGIYANKLNVITGAYQLDYASLTADPNSSPITNAIAATDNAPASGFSLDVAAIGGMYANKIRLIGTESGLGVNQAGTLQSAGDLIITASGQLLHSGTSMAANNLNITGNTISNSGSMLAGGDVNLVANTLTQTTGAQIAAGVDADGKLTQNGSLNLNISNSLTVQGDLLAGGSLQLDVGAGGANLRETRLRGTDINITVSSANDGSGGDLDLQDASLAATGAANQGSGNINLQSRDINARGAQVAANGTIRYTARRNIDLSSSTRKAYSEANRIVISGANLNNAGGRIVALDNRANAEDALQIKLSGTLNNLSDGLIGSNGNVSLSVGELDNGDPITGGLIVAGNNLKIDFGNSDFNYNASSTDSRGRLSAGNDLSLTTTGTISNSGELQAPGTLSIVTGSLTNTGVIAGNDVDIRFSESLINTGRNALIGAARDLHISSGSTSIGRIENTDNATLFAGRDIAIKAGNIFNTDAAINAERDSLIEADSFTNESTGWSVTSSTISSSTKSWQSYLYYGMTPYTGLRAIQKTIDLADIATNWILVGTGGASNYKQTVVADISDILSHDTETRAMVFRLRVDLDQCADRYPCPATNDIRINYESYQSLGGGKLEISFYPNFDPNTMLHPEGPSYNYHGYEFDRILTTRLDRQTAISPAINATVRTGRDLQIKVDSLLRNKFGLISAGNDLNIIAGGNRVSHSDAQENRNAQVVNDGISLYETTTVTGNTWNVWEVRKGMSDSAYISIPTSVTQTPYDTIRGTIQAGNTLSITTPSLNNAQSGPSTITSTNPSASGSSTAAGSSVNPVPSNLPNNALLQQKPDANAQYLIESNPKFTQYSQFISSNYMMQRLGLDSATMGKRLGDGYYEQALVREQINKLVGQRYLPSLYASLSETDKPTDLMQFQALMESGVTQAQQFKFQIGIALSAEQIAALTGDMVWLVRQTVTAADGSLQSVLVPQVYLAANSLSDASATLTAGGALLTGRTVQLSANAFTNQGGITGQDITVRGINLRNQGGEMRAANTLTMAAESQLSVDGGALSARRVDLSSQGDLQLQTTTTQVGNQVREGGNFSSSTNTALTTAHIQGETVSLSAGRDVTMQAAGISAQQINATAGRDLRIESLEQKSSSTGGGDHVQFNIQSTSIVGSKLSASNEVRLAAGNDLTINSSTVQSSEGGISANAGRNIALTTSQETFGSNFSGSVGSASFSRQESGANDIGSALQASGDIQLQAGNDISARAASVTSTLGNLGIRAGNDVSVVAGESRYSLEESRQNSSSGLLSSSSSFSLDTLNSNTAVGSTFSGNSVNIDAGRNLGVKGSTIVSNSDLSLTAQTDVSIEAASNSRSASQVRQSSESGLLSGGGASGFTIGERSQSLQQSSSGTSATASVVGSNTGNVDIRAGNLYRQTGSDVVAVQGDININAKNIAITEARETSQTRVESSMQQSGLSVGVSSVALNAIQTIEKMDQAASETSSGRTKLLAGASAALAAKTGIDAIRNGQGDANGQIKNADGSLRDVNIADQLGGVSLSLSLGSSSSRSSASSSSDTARGSSVSAGRDIRIQANGAGTDSNLLVQGSEVNAGGNLALQSEGAIQLLAAENKAQQQSSHSGSSSSVGLSLGLGTGPSNGLGVSASASRSSGQSNGSDTGYTNSRLSGDKVSLQSGGDTKLRGAVVNGNRINVEVDGNLLVQSLQDRSEYREQNQSTSLSATVPLGTGTAGGSLSQSQTRINSNYQSVIEQSGLRAGDDGFGVTVKGDTTLMGGAITSSEAAVQQRNNTFQTDGTLRLADINNQANYIANSIGVTLGASGAGQLGLPLTSAGVGSASDSAQSTTQSAISGIAGNSAARTGDQSTPLARIFDAEKVRNDIVAQVTITAEFGKQASQTVSTYIDGQRSALRAAQKQATTPAEKASLQSQINDLTLQERVLNVLIGAVSGQGGSALTKESLSAAAEQMRNLMIEDSTTFRGVVDSTGFKLSNLSGESVGVRGDGLKIGGTRVDLDLLCGTDNRRCRTEVNSDGTQKLDQNGKTQLAKDAQGRVIFTEGSLESFIQTPEGQKMVGATGGIQGYKGTLFGIPYNAGSLPDLLIEAFAGTHDFIGGNRSGLYDKQGNIKRGMSEAERNTYDTKVTTAAIVPSIPFAVAEFLSPEVWKAISILIKNSR